MFIFSRLGVQEKNKQNQLLHLLCFRLTHVIRFKGNLMKYNSYSRAKQTNKLTPLRKKKFIKARRTNTETVRE